MQTTGRFLMLFSLLLVWSGCDRDSDQGPTSEPDQTDGRMTIVTDEARLSERMTDEEVDISVDTTLLKSSARMAFRLTLRATVTPPTVGGQKLQATSVTLDNSYAIVSYAMAGSQAIGGVDVIDISSSTRPKIKSSATFTDTDVNAAVYSSNVVYLAEATNNPAFDPLTAIVEKISCNNGKLSLSGSVRRGLSSYVATSTHVSGTTLYVTTGNTGYLYRLSTTTMTVLDSVALSDARWVHTDNSNIVVIQGTPGQLNVRNKTSGAQTAVHSFAGAGIPESKSTVQIIGGKALIAAGDGGVKLIDLATGIVVGSLPRVVVAGLDSSVTVTNAVSGSGQYIYSSNGEAGIYVARASQNLSNSTGTTPITLTSLGKLQFSNLQSVNHVALDGSNLIVAAGLGGVKIVRMTL